MKHILRSPFLKPQHVLKLSYKDEYAQEPTSSPRIRQDQKHIPCKWTTSSAGHEAPLYYELARIVRVYALKIIN